MVSQGNNFVVDQFERDAVIPVNPMSNKIEKWTFESKFFPTTIMVQIYQLSIAYPRLFLQFVLY